MKTERLNLLISPADKAAITARASALNLSTSELIRRAVSAYEPESDDEELRALAEEFLKSVARTEQALDAAMSRLETFDERLERARSEVRESVSRAGDEWPFPLSARAEASV